MLAVFIGTIHPCDTDRKACMGDLFAVDLYTLALGTLKATGTHTPAFCLQWLEPDFYSIYNVANVHSLRDLWCTASGLFRDFQC
jgi:hypothetical protein